MRHGHRPKPAVRSACSEGQLPRTCRAQGGYRRRSRSVRSWRVLA
jgi:hypothetical protein